MSEDVVIILTLIGLILVGLSPFLIYVLLTQ